MLKTIYFRVMWVGRATVFLVGLAVILAVVLGVATSALAAAPGDPFKLGKANVIDTVSKLVGATANTMLLIDNNGTGSALQLQVEEGKAPLTVNSSAARATNLNADKVDGQEASDLAEPRGYAHVKPEGIVDSGYPSKGVNGVVIAEGETSLYCFDLAFTPQAAVGSPFFTNNATVATVTPPNAALAGSCPAGHKDAAVKTYAAESGSAAPINFQVVFE